MLNKVYYNIYNKPKMLCLDAVERIFDFIIPAQDTYESIVDIYVNANTNPMTNVIVDKHQWERYRHIFHKVDRLHYFSTQYPLFVKQFKKYVDHPNKWWRIDNYDLYQTCLLDAVSSDIYLPLVQKTHKNMSPAILRDIGDMVELFPEMVQSAEGTMRCRCKVTVLYLAITNTKIPIALVDKIARQHKLFNVPMTIDVNGDAIHIIQDLDSCEISRISQLEI